MYQDAGPIEASIADTTPGRLLIAAAVALILAAVLLVGFDGTSRRLGRQNRRLRELTDGMRDSEARFRSLAQNASDLVLVVDHDGTVRYVSVSVDRILGFPPDDLVGRKLAHAVHADDREILVQQLASIADRPGADIEGETRVAHKDGRWRVFEWTARNLADEPSIGGFVINGHDVTDRTDLEAQLRHQAFHDPLTGLANRALFADRVEHSLARAVAIARGRRCCSWTSTTSRTSTTRLGHGSGDQLLRRGLATRAATPSGRATRRRDCRGDEFAVLLEEIGDVERALEVADRILDG